MGCSEDRFHRSQEEIELCSKHPLLGVYRMKSEAIDLTIRKYSSGDYITLAQMRHITGKLGIPGYDSPNASVSRFYSHLLAGNSFKRSEYVLTCILLGSASTSTKSQLIFEAYDEDSSKVMELAEFDAMWASLVQVCSYLLPAMLSPPSASVAQYLDKLQLCLLDAKHAAQMLLFDENATSITLPMFRHRTSMGRMKALLDPSLLRVFIFRFYRKQSRKPPIMLRYKSLNDKDDKKSTLHKAKTEFWMPSGQEGAALHGEDRPSH